MARAGEGYLGGARGGGRGFLREEKRDGGSRRALLHEGARVGAA